MPLCLTIFDDFQFVYFCLLIKIGRYTFAAVHIKRNFKQIFDKSLKTILKFCSDRKVFDMLQFAR